MGCNRILTDRIRVPPHHRNRIRVDRIAPSRTGRNRIEGTPHGVHRIRLIRSPHT